MADRKAKRPAKMKMKKWQAVLMKEEWRWKCSAIAVITSPWN